MLVALGCPIVGHMENVTCQPLVAIADVHIHSTFAGGGRDESLGARAEIERFCIVVDGHRDATYLVCFDLPVVLTLLKTLFAEATRLETRILLEVTRLVDLVLGVERGRRHEVHVLVGVVWRVCFGMSGT